jgi:hypothetical protein
MATSKRPKGKRKNVSGDSMTKVERQITKVWLGNTPTRPKQKK